MKEVIDNHLTRVDSVGYKFTSPGVSDYAGYFNIVGSPTPEAFFVNSKDMKSFQWITALMTSWSRQIRAGVEIEAVIKDAKNTFQPGGSYFISGDLLKGVQVHSVIHHLGLLLEIHMKEVEKNK